MNRRRALVLGIATPLAVLTPMQAWAYFPVGSAALNSSAAVSALGAPTVSGSQAITKLIPLEAAATIKVTAKPSSGPTPTGYRVDRTGPTAATGVCTITGSTGSCSDPAASATATNQYSVYPVLDNWVGSAPAHVNTKLIPDHFTFSGFTSPVTAGTSFQVTITAKTLLGATDTSFTGTQSLAVTGASNAPGGATPTLPTTADFVAGVATVDVTLVKAGIQTLTFADSNGMAAGNAIITVRSAALSSLTLSGPATVGVGIPTGAFTLIAKDAFGNPYSGSASVVWSGAASGAPSYPSGSVTFLNGTALTALTATFDTAQTVALVATVGAVASNPVSIIVG